MRRLERWTPYRRLRSCLLVLAGTGAWLHLAPRFESPTWGYVEWIHVALGLLSMALYAGYQTHHLATKWRQRHGAALASGVALALALVAAEASGLVLLGPLTGEGSQLARDVHLGATVIAGLALAAHLASRVAGWRAPLPD